MNNQPIKLTAPQFEALKMYGELITVRRNYGYYRAWDLHRSSRVCRNLHAKGLLARMREQFSYGTDDVYRITDIGLKWLADNEKEG